jgi:segregation and condensation protein B
LPNKILDDDSIETDEIDVGSLRDSIETDEIDVGSLRAASAGASRLHDFESDTEDWDDLAPEDEELLFHVAKEEPSNFAGHDPEDFGPHLPADLGPVGARERESSFFPMQALLTLEAQVEAVIFASPKAVKVGDILEIIGGEDVGAREVQDVINSLLVFYEERGGGFKLEHVRGGGYQFRTTPAAAPLMEKIFASRPRPLSRAAQETLAIVAYRQPASRADIEFIRGVDAGSIIKNLLERELIRCVGRKEDSGRPMVFGTTDEFLRVYQLDSLKDLPPLDSFQPSQDMMQAATARLEDNEDVDVEEFMEDRDDLDGDEDDMELLVGNDEGTETLKEQGIEAVTEEPISLSGATIEDKESFEEDTFDTLSPDDIERPL